MPTTFSTRPDPNFYINIMQGADGNWSADQMALDDVAVTIPMHGDVLSKGLRTLTKENVDSYAFQSVMINAPPDMQRNALYTISLGTGATGYTAAKNCMDWIVAMNAHRDTVKASIDTMTFDQIVVFVVAETGWPAVPSVMPPKSFEPGVTQSRLIKPFDPSTRRTT